MRKCDPEKRPHLFVYLCGTRFVKIKADADADAAAAAAAGADTKHGNVRLYPLNMYL